MKFILCMIISFLSNTALAEEKMWPGSPPDCWRESRNVHSYDDFHSLIEQNIKITNRAAEKPSQGEISPNKAYLFIKKIVGLVVTSRFIQKNPI
ncbi:hypothetical protein [Undibacterium curvum]|uniref:Uncharacterized protein n=1 Tax=Undibacterium curvum TaxID=2762294 RepID=A0ABR6ZZS9_9BURK|nr:hypothetical protein [Undibacterium curvum]MBC3930144.1 hypothetical protein [Undibacterium curvum]